MFTKNFKELAKGALTTGKKPKQPRIYQKFFTREVPLIEIEYWYEGERHGLAKLVENTMHFDPLFIRDSNGLVSTYYEINNPKTALQPMFDFFNDNQSKFNKLVKKFYLVEKRLVRLNTGFSSNSFGPLYYAIVDGKAFSPIWVQFGNVRDGKISSAWIKRAYKLRDRLQILEHKVDKTMYSEIGNRYHKLKNYADVISFKEVQSGHLPSLKTLKTRKKGFVYFNGKIMSVSKKKFAKKFGIVFLEEIATIGKTGSEVQRGTNSLEKSVIRGEIGSKGKARGRVHIILKRDQFKNFAGGEILVTSMTRPEFVPLMKKSAAVITDEGGITCHAAIISREMNKPCIIGTKIATKALRDGDFVEVDADSGIIRILERNK